MAGSDSFGLVLILVFAALLLGVIFLALKRRSKGVLGSWQLIAGVIIALAVMFVVVRKPLTDYLGHLFRAEPYDFSDLKSMVFKYGVKDSLLNRYDSSTGEYDYLDRRDSLVKTHLNLTRNDLIYLHRKATELGFWEYPVNEVNNDTTNTNGEKPAEYVIQFNYRQKSKTVTFSANYDGPAELVKENLELIGEIEMVLKGAEQRSKK
jgi:hypothetical protein